MKGKLGGWSGPVAHLPHNKINTVFIFFGGYACPLAYANSSLNKGNLGAPTFLMSSRFYNFLPLEALIVFRQVCGSLMEPTYYQYHQQRKLLTAPILSGTYPSLYLFCFNCGGILFTKESIPVDTLGLSFSLYLSCRICNFFSVFRFFFSSFSSELLSIRGVKWREWYRIRFSSTLISISFKYFGIFFFFLFVE